MFKTAKKLVSVLAISILVIGADMEDTLLLLERVLCFQYPLYLQKNTADVRALIDFSSKVNAITRAYILKLGLKVYPTNVEAQKIDGFPLQTFEMVLSSFWVEDKLGWACFFQETFLFVNTSMRWF